MKIFFFSFRIRLHTVLAHMILTVIDILCAVSSAISCCTFACVVCKMIDAFRTIFTWIEFSAEWNFRFTILTRETGRTLTRIWFNSINASAIIFTFVLAAIVNVHFTTWSSITSYTAATETAFFKYGASSISAWIAITCVNHEFTMFAMITGFANTFV